MALDPNRPSDGPPLREVEVRDHLANERTLLAWQRTAIAMVGIGFVVARFAFEPTAGEIRGTVLGAALILAGAATSVVGAYRFVRTEREIDTRSYQPSIFAHLALAAVVAVAAIAIAVFAILAPT